MTLNKKEIRANQSVRNFVREYSNEMTEVCLKILDEKNDRIRSLEIVILTLAEADENSNGGLTTQELAKNAVLSYNIKCGWNKGERK